MQYSLYPATFFTPEPVHLLAVWYSRSAQNIFGYCRDDGFKKKKNLGRVEQIDLVTGKSTWSEIEKRWIDLYRNRKAEPGESATYRVTGNDEWLCEAYMKTDYTKLTEQDFQQTINDYLAYLVKEGRVYES